MREKRNIYLIALIMVLTTISSVGYAAIFQDLSITGEVSYSTKENYKPICKRATKLHTEECERDSDGCFETGYYEGGSMDTSTITYGSLGEDDKSLTTGDAFDCDVNGDGYYDPKSERFYYVISFEDDYENEYATLIYYNDVTEGEPVTEKAAYYNYHYDIENNLGPTVAFEPLPVIEQWPNVKLSNPVRQLFTETGDIYNINGELPEFEYYDKTARLLTTKEISKACDIDMYEYDFYNIGVLDKCEFLLENTFYSTTSDELNAGSWWLENPYSNNSSSVWFVDGQYRFLGITDAINILGVRPAIEVEISQIDLKKSNSEPGETDPIDEPKEDPLPDGPKCKRATTLHTETCDRTSYGCYATGYYEEGTKGTTTITYGSFGTEGTLTPGDAFDCDVNGDGNYDPATERFYYVSGLDGDDTSEYAVLIFFTVVRNGEAFTGNSETYSVIFDYSSNNYEGPKTAYTHLPTTTQWRNVSLSNQTRQIYNENGGTTVTNSFGSGTFDLPEFTYANKAARLLSYKEVSSVCDIIHKMGELDTCEYLLEHTQYVKQYYPANYWIETPVSTESWEAYTVEGTYRYLYKNSVTNPYGVRPVIEVLKTDIDY